jgi:hypothetical protein
MFLCFSSISCTTVLTLDFENGCFALECILSVLFPGEADKQKRSVTVGHAPLPLSEMISRGSL